MHSWRVHRKVPLYVCMYCMHACMYVRVYIYIYIYIYIYKFYGHIWLSTDGKTKISWFLFPKGRREISIPQAVQIYSRFHPSPTQCATRGPSPRSTAAEQWIRPQPSPNVSSDEFRKVWFPRILRSSENKPRVYFATQNRNIRRKAQEIWKLIS